MHQMTSPITQKTPTILQKIAPFIQNCQKIIGVNDFSEDEKIAIQLYAITQNIHLENNKYILQKINDSESPFITVYNNALPMNSINHQLNQNNFNTPIDLVQFILTQYFTDFNDKSPIRLTKENNHLKITCSNQNQYHVLRIFLLTIGIDQQSLPPASTTSNESLYLTLDEKNTNILLEKIVDSSLKKKITFNTLQDENILFYFGGRGHSTVNFVDMHQTHNGIPTKPRGGTSNTRNLQRVQTPDNPRSDMATKMLKIFETNSIPVTLHTDLCDIAYENRMIFQPEEDTPKQRNDIVTFLKKNNIQYHKEKYVFMVANTEQPKVNALYNQLNLSPNTNPSTGHASHSTATATTAYSGNPTFSQPYTPPKTSQQPPTTPSVLTIPHNQHLNNTNNVPPQPKHQIPNRSVPTSLAQSHTGQGTAYGQSVNMMPQPSTQLFAHNNYTHMTPGQSTPTTNHTYLNYSQHPQTFSGSTQSLWGNTSSNYFPVNQLAMTVTSPSNTTDNFLVALNQLLNFWQCPKQTCAAETYNNSEGYSIILLNHQTALQLQNSFTQNNIPFACNNYTNTVWVARTPENFQKISNITNNLQRSTQFRPF